MTADWIAFGYFAYLALCGGVAPRVSWRRRLFTIALSLLIAWLAFQAATVSSPAAIGRARYTWRSWLPLVWLLAGYWLPALLWRGPMPRVEAWLQASDRWLARTPLAGARDRPLLEAAYLLVHPIVPAAWLVLQGGGHAALADRFWSATLTAGFVCYGTLPWIQTRPPRLLARGDRPASEPGARPHGLRALNHHLLRLVGVRANTFPSGHAAIATVVALCIVSAMPLAGLAFLLLAALIAVATVVCRYHYTADTLLGVMLGVAVWAGIWLRP